MLHSVDGEVEEKHFGIIVSTHVPQALIAHQPAILTPCTQVEMQLCRPMYKIVFY